MVGQKLFDLFVINAVGWTARYVYLKLKQMSDVWANELIYGMENLHGKDRLKRFNVMQ